MTPTPSQTSTDPEAAARREPSPRAVEVGATLGRYRLLRLLGEGGMGAVFEAVHEDLGRRVALKTLLPALAERTVARERFFREARAAARVRHPGVVQVHDADSDDGVVYLVMDLLEGETLTRRLERGPLEVGALLRLLGPALEGLAHAHAVGVIHRDIKPSNLFVVPAPEGERAVLLDFGVSRMLDEESDLTGSATVLGTPAYMSPEQARGARDVGAASDQFSMGAVLFTCLTGRRPFEGSGALELAWSIQHDRRERLAKLRPDLPRHVVAAVERALATEPEARFPGVAALHDALRAPPPSTRRSRLAAAAFAALALPLGVWGVTRPRAGAAPIAAASAAVPSRPAVARVEVVTANTTAIVRPPTTSAAPTPNAPPPRHPQARTTAPHALGRGAARAREAAPPAVPEAAGVTAPPTASATVTITPPPAPTSDEPAAPSRGRNRALILGR